MFSIGIDKKTETARILNVLIEGERVASTVAAAQSKFCAANNNPKFRRFFSTQANQERFHARFIQAGKLALRPKDVRSGAERIFRETLVNELELAIQRQDLHESVLGLQIIVETLGELLLTNIDEVMEQRGLGLKRMRRLIIHQEMAHHGFGERYFERRVGEQERLSLRQPASRYLDISFALLRDVDTLFETFGADRKCYEDALVNNVNAVLS